MKKPKNVARMQYQTDKRSAAFCFLAIIFDVVYFLALYSNNDLSPDFQMGLDVLCNIIFLLFAFLASEKVKVYDKQWAYFTGLVGLIQILRIFWVPAHFLAGGALTQGRWLWLVIPLALSGASLLVSAASCYQSSTTLGKFLEKGENHG